MSADFQANIRHRCAMIFAGAIAKEHRERHKGSPEAIEIGEAARSGYMRAFEDAERRLARASMPQSSGAQPSTLLGGAQ